MTKIGIIIGNTRPGRKAETVARWVHGIASRRTDAEFELVAVGGARAVEHLRLVVGELQIADVRAQVALSLFTDFEDFTVLTPSPSQEQHLTVMLDQVVAWSTALRSVRQPAVVG